MSCCAECFGDRGLSRSIIPLRSTTNGRCAYCETDGVAIIDPTELAEYFELLVSAYRTDDTGKLLVHLFREDWALFQNPRMMDDARAQGLLSDIFSGAEITRQLFVPASDPTADRLSEWENLCDELMYRNRYFPEKTIDLDRLESLLSPLTLDPGEVPAVWYRARIQTVDLPYTADQMGAPSKRAASHGRANPAGIPYLYLGSDRDTAVSEIRPYTGETACVGAFTTPLDLKLADLRNPRKMVSPFVLADAEDIGKMRNDLPFLEKLGDELTRPVLPLSAAIDYTPSQYLCEFIKKCGYQGVVYRSSVSDGINLALFDPALAQCGPVTQYRVNRVSVEVESIDAPHVL
jgi:hypothetical protein